MLSYSSFAGYSSSSIYKFSNELNILSIFYLSELIGINIIFNW